MLGRVIAAVLFAVAVTATASAQDMKPPEFGRYHALVIGNNEYQHVRNLTTAVGDADAVATLLEEKYGFQVTKLTNATRLDITGAFNRLRQSLTEKDNLLVYYAGHGVLDEEAGAGYWLPVDARQDDDSKWFSNTRLTNYLKAMSAQHVMVVADSCYSGNLTRVATSTVRSGAERTAWIERMNDKRSRTALTSGGLEPVLDQGGRGHSVFARAFLTALDESPDVLFGEELFDRMKGVVVANAEQTPEYSDIRHTGHEKGDFLFVPRDISVSVTVQTTQPTAKPDSSAFELTFWQSIQNSDDSAMFEAYLGRYPTGEFADIAKLKIQAIAKAKEQQTALVIPPKPEIDPIETTYVAVKNANVRKEPTVRSAKVTTLKRGTKVQVAGKVKGRNWYLVERADKPLGYVYGELLMEPEAAKLALAAPPKPAAGSRAPIRSGPARPSATALTALRWW